MHRPTLLLTDSNSPPTPRRSSILRRSSLVTTEISLALTQYATQVSSRTATSLLVHYYPSLEKTKSHPLPLLLVFQVSLKVPLPSNPPPGTEPKSGGGFCLTAEEVLRRKNNNLCSYCGSKDHLLPACPLSKCSSFVNKSSTLTLLSLINTSKSLTVLVTINGPLGKIKVLVLLCCVWLQVTTSWRTRREIFITKDLRFEDSLELAFKEKLRAHTLISC
ncbi:hypothetical protein DSO57_1033723 [Entomophthora muscae]|uniref:Uncharacterized protein n=1 Tax=Entomophthora muscae TaxID=34485 RepID=A0ACC2SP42_9FUNG|nr:hypothetical protein DSO57_1033723 [Entomophthora muscae]